MNDPQAYNLSAEKVSGGTTTVYIFSGGKVIGEYVNGAAPGSPTREYMYFGDRLLSTLEAGATKYHLRDHLSARVSTDATGAVIGQQGHFPFGEFWYSTSTTIKWQFTSYERDAESGNDYAMVRCYANRLGRFSSPDPVLGDMHNPQRLNRYAYALNDPLNLIDPLSLDCAYLNDIGDGIEFIDRDSNSEECMENGGFWADGWIIGGWIDPNSDNVLLLTQGWDANGNVQYGWTQAGTLQGPGGVTWSSATQWAYPTANGDVPLTPFAQAVLGQVYQNSSAVTNPVNIGLWYGGSALAGLGGWVLYSYGPAAWGWTLANGQKIADCAAGALSPTPGGPGFWGNVCSAGVQGGTAIYNKLKTQKK